MRGAIDAPVPRPAGPTQSPLPSERAFVVHFRSRSEAGGELFVGRVEHIATGVAGRFASTAELVGFVKRVLEPNEGEQ